MSRLSIFGLVPALFLAACSDGKATRPDGGLDLEICTEDAECGEGRFCDGAICATGERIAAPGALRVDPAMLDFGAVQIGARSSKTLTLDAVGSDVLVSEITFVRAAGTNGPDEVAMTTSSALPRTLRAGGDALTVAVTYAPRDAAADRGDVVIRLGGGASWKIPLTSMQDGAPALGIVASVDAARTQLRSGAGFVPLPEIDFGRVDGTAVVEKRMHLINAGEGNTPLVITKVSLAPTAPPISPWRRRLPSPAPSTRSCCPHCAPRRRIRSRCSRSR